MYGFDENLPVKVGETVWRVDRKNARIVPMRVHSYHLFGSRRDVVELVEAGSYSEVHTRWKVYQFGKVLFASEDAAKKALFDHR